MSISFLLLYVIFNVSVVCLHIMNISMVTNARACFRISHRVEAGVDVAYGDVGMSGSLTGEELEMNVDICI